MKTKQLKRLFSVILCVVLIAVTALFTVGCSNNEKDTGTELPQTNNSEKTDDTSETTAGETSDDEKSDVKILGEGSKQFDFSVVDLKGNETKFIIKTDKKTVGEALLDVELVEGDDGPYGLYVKKVNGITADYDVDQTYWGFFVDGEYAMNGVDQTEIEEGKSYSFKISK